VTCTKIAILLTQSNEITVDTDFVRQKVRNEINSTLEGVNKLTATSLSKLSKYTSSLNMSLLYDLYVSDLLEYCLKETRRLASGLPTRLALKTTQYKGYTIPAGCFVTLATSLEHYNPKVSQSFVKHTNENSQTFPNPFEYDPEAHWINRSEPVPPEIANSVEFSTGFHRY
jgi:hypothetical protein